MKASSLVIEMSPTKDLPEEEEVMVAEAEDIRINKIIIMTAFNLKAGKIIINNDKGKINNNSIRNLIETKKKAHIKTIGISVRITIKIDQLVQITSQTKDSLIKAIREEGMSTSPIIKEIGYSNKLNINKGQGRGIMNNSQGRGSTKGTITLLVLASEEEAEVVNVEEDVVGVANFLKSKLKLEEIKKAVKKIQKMLQKALLSKSPKLNNNTKISQKMNNLKNLDQCNKLRIRNHRKLNLRTKISIQRMIKVKSMNK